MSKDSKKIVLSKSKSSLSASSSSNSPLPIYNSFTPLSPFPRLRPSSPTPISSRPPYSSIVQTTRMLPQSIIRPNTPSVSTSTTDSSLYIINPNHKIIKILEPIEEEKVSQSFLTLIDYLYPRNCHFFDSDKKNIDYYQAILVDTESVVIQHILNSQNPSKIDYSKIKIKKVIKARAPGIGC
ncbi:hypothetical protein E3N88_23461 [Mikania micrantha]|uniref:Uncharacterized protein n=1 Tax=Mikania micrantha TaxID=192012 RepID=A0A5N6NF09_9ASTR|nr:hypothetical protein E3N88_23461 [Mikania micrantha]